MRRVVWSDRALWFAMAIAISSGDFASLRAQAPAAASIVQVRLAPWHEQYRRRIENAANESLARFSEWLGPLPAQNIVIVDRRDAADSTAIAVDLPWRPAPSTMDVESQVAYGIARLWWASVVEDEPSRPIANGIAWYLQSRIVERLYDFAFLNPGHSADAVRFFGGAVPREFPLLRMSRWTSGLARPEFLRLNTPRGWPAAARRLPGRLPAATLRVALAVGSLEREIGWPAVQGALFESARRARSGPFSQAQLGEAMSASAGQDVSWAFAVAHDNAGAVDYAIRAWSSARCPSGNCVVTKVTVERIGHAAGPRDVELRVDFADGQQVEARWDGDEIPKQFEFESPAAPIGVHVDPNRTVLLDANWLNNDRLVTPQTNVPIRKWVARWLVWLQDASLSYASLF